MQEGVQYPNTQLCRARKPADRIIFPANQKHQAQDRGGSPRLLRRASLPGCRRAACFACFPDHVSRYAECRLRASAWVNRYANRVQLLYFLAGAFRVVFTGALGRVFTGAFGAAVGSGSQVALKP